MKRQVPDSVQFGNNPVAIAQLATFYIKDGMRVADVTYGKGIFWRNTDASRFKLYPTDLVPVAPSKKGGSSSYAVLECIHARSRA